MYYRRKILLALLQALGGERDKLSLQKLLFLLTVRQSQKSFHFVPYKYGCFSFQANADLFTMVKYKLIAESENKWEKTDNVDYIKELKSADRYAISEIKNTFKDYSCDDLIKVTYRNYPYYAMNSVIAHEVLDEEEITAVEKQKKSFTETVLFTIGYEGISLEEYLNKLIKNGIGVLCDVRKNPLSMKYGFSKTQLQNACKGVNIEYVHFPEVGIDSDMRQELNTQSDYDNLFSIYKETTLKDTIERQIEILTLLKNKKRIALTCFEADINQCHRKYLAESVSGLNNFVYEIKHI